MWSFHILIELSWLNDTNEEEIFEVKNVIKWKVCVFIFSSFFLISEETREEKSWAENSTKQHFSPPHHDLSSYLWIYFFMLILLTERKTNIYFFEGFTWQRMRNSRKRRNQVRREYKVEKSRQRITTKGYKFRIYWICYSRLLSTLLFVSCFFVC